MIPIARRMQTSRIAKPLPIKIGGRSYWIKEVFGNTKVELTTSQKEEFNSQRAERREYNKDAEKDSSGSLERNSRDPQSAEEEIKITSNKKCF